jgi:hypothetical protein
MAIEGNETINIYIIDELENVLPLARAYRKALLSRLMLFWNRFCVRSPRTYEQEEGISANLFR